MTPDPVGRDHRLSHGALARICRGEDVGSPLLQVMAFRLVKKGAEER